MSGKKPGKWLTIERSVIILSGIASLITIITLPIVIYQLLDIKKNQYDRSAQLLGLFTQQFYSGSNPDVRHTIAHEGPLLEKHGGPITDSELEGYLDIYETISDAYDRELIDHDMLYTYESYYIEKAYQNDEIRDYIAEIRKEDPEFYNGFEDLAKMFLKEDGRSELTIKNLT